MIAAPSLLRRFSRPRNLPISHPISFADRPVFPGFLAFKGRDMGAL
jgi:hypothetical protein